MKNSSFNPSLVKNVRRALQPGMTFLEIIIVVAIIAGLLAIAGPAILRQFGGAQVDQTVIQIRNLQQALDLYRLDTGTYPDSEQGLKALMLKPSVGRIPTKWRGPYLKGKVLPVDPWGNEYIYVFENSSYVLTSYGADGAAGGSEENKDIISSEF